MIAACFLLTKAFPSKPWFAGMMMLVLLSSSIMVWKNLPPWNPMMITSGVFDRPDYLKDELRRRNVKALKENRPLKSSAEAVRLEIEREKLLFYEEGPDAIVTVTYLPHPEPPPLKFLRINGKCDASSYNDLPTQVCLAQFGMCLHPEPKRVLLIGLGSGISLGSVLTHSEVQDVDVVEVSPSVVRAAAHFETENGNALGDPRVRMIINDGRNHVMATQQKYDVIVSEPSNPWMTGVANLFALEHYRNCRERLNSNGLMCQWFHLYSNTPEITRMLIRTFQEVFPHSTLWFCETDAFLVGSSEPWKPDLEVVQRHFLENPVASDLRRVKIDDVSKFMEALLLQGENLKRYTGLGPWHQDEHPRVEFLLPFALYQMNNKEIFQEIRSFMPLKQ
jgi:spermidine synthase